jgi:hypothetical protein
VNDYFTWVTKLSTAPVPQFVDSSLRRSPDPVSAKSASGDFKEQTVFEGDRAATRIGEMSRAKLDAAPISRHCAICASEAAAESEINESQVAFTFSLVLTI